MYTDMKQMQPEDLIGNFVYESCLAGIWNVPFESIYVWEINNDLGISYNDILDFASSCNFKIAALNGEEVIAIPKWHGEFSNLEYLKRKYRIGMQTTSCKQIQQSMSQYLAGRQTSIFGNVSSAHKEDKDDSVCKWIKHLNNYTASCGEDLIPLMRGFRFCPYCGRKLEVQN